SRGATVTSRGRTCRGARRHASRPAGGAASVRGRSRGISAGADDRDQADPYRGAMALTRRNPCPQQYIEKLAAVPLLRGLSRKELELVGRQVDEVTVDSGRVLVEDGRPGR